MELGLDWRNLTRILLLIISLAAFPLHSASNIEVAMTAPVETKLQVEGIPSTGDVWLKMIKAAQSSIDLEQFYIYSKSGQSLEPILDALKGAASRGVQIRFLVDSKFYKTYPQIPDQLAPLENFEVKTIDYSSTGGIQHAKFFIVDQSESFIGSANFDWLALTHIHEVGLRVSDPVIAQNLGKVFNADWEMGNSLSRKVPNPNSLIPEEPKLIPQFGSDALELNLVASPASKNPKGIGESLNAILELLANAKSTVKIQVYQYTTKLFSSSAKWTTLDTAIRKAAARGVKVQLLVDAVALKTGAADLKALKAINNIQVRTVTIPQWSGGFIDYARLIHSKYLIADESAAWVGTENWSGDYFTNSRNVGLVVSSPAVAAQLNQIYNQVWNSPYVTR